MNKLLLGCCVLILHLLMVTVHADSNAFVFENMPLPQLLSRLAKGAQQNVIIDEHIEGNATIRLTALTWRQALDTVIEGYGLQKINLGHAWLIQMQSSGSHEQTVATEFMALHYIKAKDALAFIKKHHTAVLGTSSIFNVDEHSNRLMVTAPVSAIKLIKTMILQIDKPNEQVEIAARVVLISREHSRELGGRLMIGQPNKTQLTGSAHHVGVSLYGASFHQALDIELKALENSGLAEVVSRPRLVTENRQVAIIEAGEEIPFVVRDETKLRNKVTTTFKKAVLSLRVTPHVLPGKQIKLHLTVRQDARGVASVDGPAINTQKIETQVTVPSGKTLVLGGINSQTTQFSQKRTPWFWQLPLIGLLFNVSNNIDKSRELLIFVTPKILSASDGQDI